LLPGFNLTRGFTQLVQGARKGDRAQLKKQHIFLQSFPTKYRQIQFPTIKQQISDPKKKPDRIATFTDNLSIYLLINLIKQLNKAK
jgi:type II secretory pathway component PulL